MTIAELVFEQVKTLPEPQAREVLAFVERMNARSERASSVDLMMAQSRSLLAIWDNDEDAVWDDV